MFNFVMSSGIWWKGVSVAYNCDAGMSKLIETVEAVVRDVLGATSLKDSMTSADVHDLLHEVRRQIETHRDGRPATQAAGLYRFMLPDSDAAAQVGALPCSELVVSFGAGVSEPA